MTPDPTPQPHDHGAAGFCTDHAQAPDERTETVARALREHGVRSYDEECFDCTKYVAPHRDHIAAVSAAVVAALNDEADLTAARAALDRVRADALREAADVLVAFAEDTYPRDIFIEPSRQDYTEINALLDRERGHMLDGVSADCYRRALAVGASELRDRAAALDPEEPR